MTYFVVTSRRVIYRTGVLSKRGVEIPLERINNINFHQRIIDRIIGAGDLDIESAGKDGQSHFDFIRHPDGVQHEIYRQMEFRNMPRDAAQRPVAGAARPRRPRACPSRSSSSRSSATRATSPRPSTSRRRRSSSSGCRSAASSADAQPSTAVGERNRVGDEPGRGAGTAVAIVLGEDVVGVVALRERDDAPAEAGTGEPGAGGAALDQDARRACPAPASTPRSRRGGWRGSRAAAARAPTGRRVGNAAAVREHAARSR